MLVPRASVPLSRHLSLARDSCDFVNPPLLLFLLPGGLPLFWEVRLLTLLYATYENLFVIGYKFW